MPSKNWWTGVVTRHFLAKLIIVTLAVSSAVVWANRPLPAYALRGGASGGPAYNGPGAAVPVPGKSVHLVITVMPSRLIVVDENDTIVQIWSNTYGSTPGAYSVKVRRLSEYGAEQPLNGAIWDSYESLAARLDWSKMGLVYDARRRG